jgi:hypothetical protein
MSRFLLGLVFIVAAGGLLYSQFPLAYYLQPKQDRLLGHWKSDIKTLSQNQEFAKIFKKVGKVEVHFTDPQVATEFERFHTPFSPVEGQPLILRISVTRWIEKREYGFLVQHELFDETDDKIYEFGRIYKIGLIL